METSPLALAEAFTTFATPLGIRDRPTPLRRIARPAGRTLDRFRGRSKRVADDATAYLVRDLLRDAVERGTGRGAALDGVETWGKTGTSSDLRDAWFVGGAGALVTVVWVGLDDGSPLGLTGSTAALPLWKEVMEVAVPAYPSPPPSPPREIVERWVEEETELLLRRPRQGVRQEVFRRGFEPPRRRIYRIDSAVPILQ